MNEEGYKCLLLAISTIDRAIEDHRSSLVRAREREKEVEKEKKRKKNPPPLYGLSSGVMDILFPPERDPELIGKQRKDHHKEREIDESDGEEVNGAAAIGIYQYYALVTPEMKKIVGQCRKDGSSLLLWAAEEGLHELAGLFVCIYVCVSVSACLSVC